MSGQESEVRSQKSGISDRVEIGDATLYPGDCLDVLPEIETAAAVIMDPPYCSGARTSAAMTGRSGMSRGAKWKTKPLPNDQMTVTGFTWLMRQVALESARILVDGGSLLSFIDWRQYPTLYAVVESANLRVQTMIVWDKIDMALGNGFRNQHELIIHAAKGTPNVHDRSVSNVVRRKRLAKSDIHPTQKPVDLISQLLRVVSEPGDLVVDPFMGSGTTGVACAALDRRFIGIESNPEYFRTACQRIKEVQRQETMAVEPQSLRPRPAKLRQQGLL